MKIVYLDTNLYISLIKHNDVHYKAMKTIISQSHLQFVTSPVTLVELSSVISREFNYLDLKKLKLDPKSMSRTQITLLLIEFLLLKTNTRLLHDLQIEELNYFSKKSWINPIYKTALLQSANTQLHTLDLIHYAYVYQKSTVEKQRIDYILSGDENFIKNGKSSENKGEFTFITPELLEELECA